MEETIKLQHEITQFLYREARLLDNNSFKEWLELMTEDITYDMPVRLNREKGLPDAADDMGHYFEIRRTLEIRVQRLATSYAWAEDPPSRTRRLITNVNITPGSNPDELNVRSYFFVNRNRGLSNESENISGERSDVLRKVNGEWKLAKRVIMADQATLGLKNLAIFF